MKVKYYEIINNGGQIHQDIMTFVHIKPKDIGYKIALEVHLANALEKALSEYNRIRISYLEEFADETEFEGKPTKMEVIDGKLTNNYNVSETNMDLLKGKIQELAEQEVELNFTPFTVEEIKKLDYEKLNFVTLKPFIKFDDVQKSDQI
jgi:hypothetical protein